MYHLVVFLSALLLFQVQLIVAKHLLPWFGGTPAVWTTSQMFFQVLLLGGYSYAHALTRIHRPVLQYRIHLAVLLAACAALMAVALWGGDPLLAPAWMRPAGTENPILLLLGILAVCVGLPFFAVSTTGPLLQQWHSRQSTSLHSTYRLYALSNVGSFLGLLSYPVVVERQLDLAQQAWLWAVLFIAFAAGCSIIARRSSRPPFLLSGTSPQTETRTSLEESEPPHDRAVSPARMSLWLLLSAIGSVTFLATTNQLTHDVAAVPFLWALPLSVYLLTFIICFDRPQWYSRRWVPIATAAASIVVLPNVVTNLSVPIQVGAYSLFLFGFCLLCHGELVRLRPGTRHLTLFYLFVAMGGALGGIFVGLGAPVFFDDYWEFYLAITVGWVVIAVAWAVDERSPFYTGDRTLFASLVLISVVFAIRYLIERTGMGRYGLVVAHGWPLTLGGGMVLSAALCATVWTTRLARAKVWPMLLVALLAIASALFLWQKVQTSLQGVVYSARNFYGVVRVEVDEVGTAEARRLMHGTTIHGVQIDILGQSAGPTAYYSRSTGIAIASRLVVETGDTQQGVHVGVVGMGAGTMTAFARSGDRVRHYEINPEVIDIAQGPYFTFVRNSPSEVTIVLGDARLSLERELRELPQRFDLLAIDAFSSDSVPVHLITAEAFRLYAAHLNTDDSILAVNVTNRYLDLEPVVAANARELGLHGVRVDSRGDPPVVLESSWILLARNPNIATHPSFSVHGGRALRDEHVPFTDRYSNLFRVLK